MIAGSMLTLKHQQPWAALRGSARPHWLGAPQAGQCRGSGMVGSGCRATGAALGGQYIGGQGMRAAGDDDLFQFVSEIALNRGGVV